MLFQKCFAIKRGINGYLELVREMFSERAQDANGTFQNKYTDEIF